MPWFLVDAEVTTVNRIDYVVRASDKDAAADYVESGRSDRTLFERNSTVVDHIETKAFSSKELPA
jgi:hypothetical protein